MMCSIGGRDVEIVGVRVLRGPAPVPGVSGPPISGRVSGWIFDEQAIAIARTISGMVAIDRPEGLAVDRRPRALIVLSSRNVRES